MMFHLQPNHVLLSFKKFGEILTVHIPLGYAELAKILDDNFQPKTEAEIIIHPKEWKNKTFTHIIKRPFQKTAVKELERKRKEDCSDSDESDWETDDNSD